MTAATLRLLPFALASAVLHAVVLVATGDHRALTATGGGSSVAVAVRLVPAGPSPAKRSGATGSPVAQRSRHRNQPVPARPARARAPPVETEQAGDDDAVGADESAAAAQPHQRARHADAGGPRPAMATQQTRPASRSARAAAAAGDESESGETPEPAVETGDVPDRPRTVADAKPGAGAAASRERAHRPPAAVARAGGGGGRAAAAQLARRAREAVVAELGRYFRYPRLARQRGWEGRVVLACRIQSDGDVTAIRVVKGSGRAILDEAALESLRRVDRLPGLARMLAAEPLELTLPVTYRLHPG